MKCMAAIIFLCLVIPSCFLQKPYRVETFSFARQDGAYSFPMVVPKGYSKKWASIDSAGNSILTYSYKTGAIFYIAHMVDTSVEMQPLEMNDNIARQSHHTGALIYKGMDENYLYWREVRQKNIWSGYRFVNDADEYKFDSATNYLVVWPIQNTKGR